LSTPRGGAGVRHLVHISVVGADRVPVAGRVDRAMFGYFESKLATERVVAGSGLPWTTLRATQFHDLVLTTVRGLTKLPVVPVPSGMRVAAGGHRRRRGPDGRASRSARRPAWSRDLAGREVFTMGRARPRLPARAGPAAAARPVRLPGGAARAVREGALLGSGARLGRRTWEDFLAERVGRRPPGSMR
jgi:uncharacterized protein YbjT (DUF2867 family)